MATQGGGVGSDVSVRHGVAQGGEGGYVTDDATLELHCQHGRCCAAPPTEFTALEERSEIDGH